MDLHYAADLPAGTAPVYALLTNEEFLGEYARRTHAISHRVSVERGPDHTVTRVARMMPTQRVPAVLQRFVGTSIEVEEIITWRRDPVGTACIGEAAVDVPLSRTQGRFRGTARIADNATGSSMVVDGTVKVAIPLVGGKVEELLQGLLLSALRAQVSLGLEWLAAGRT